MKELESAVLFRQCLRLGVGFAPEELDRPIVGVVNSYGEVNPAAIHLGKVTSAAKAGIRFAGGTPIEFCISSVCGGMSGGGTAQRYSFATRDIISSYVEAVTRVQHFDALLFTSVCDWGVPAHLITCARLNIPSIVVLGGYMMPRSYGSEDICPFDMLSKFGLFKSGKITEEQLEVVKHGACTGSGACPQMGTANTMAAVAEAMGMTLPGNSTTAGVDNKLLTIAFHSGMQVLNLLRNKIRPRNIMTRDSVLNAIRVYLALGGSTNAIHQILDLSAQLGLDIPLETFDELGRKTPTICSVQPLGKYNLRDLDEAGGLPALMKELAPLLNLDVTTVTGRTLGENLSKAEVRRREVIHALSNPLQKEGSIAILRGNLAPNGAVVKQVAVPKKMLKYQGRAKVFNTEEEACEALMSKYLRPGDVAVIRYLGDKAEPGEIVRFLKLLVGMNLDSSIAAVTDGRLSGSDRGCAIAHVQPEAAEKGPIALVEDGDTIEIDIPNRTISVLVSSDKLANRLSDLEKHK